MNRVQGVGRPLDGTNAPLPPAQDEDEGRIARPVCSVEATG